jgi:hypothetical protein
LDSNFNVKYEVIYIELNDNQMNELGESVSANVALESNSAGLTTIHPNSFTNMAGRVGSVIGYANKSILPEWMTSRQEDGRVLGFTRAMVLCYTKPGKSKPISYRVQDRLEELRSIDFTIDRYELDGSLSKHYNLNNNSFVNFYDATGTVSFGTGSVVFGTDTLFTEELAIGQTITVNGTEIGRIQQIISDTELWLFGHSPIIVTDQPFKHSIGETTFDRATDATTFDYNKTRFYGNRITYTTPGEGDKYLKFPQIGVIS